MLDKKNIIGSILAILVGLGFILAPFFYDYKRVLILFGIVPLWMGIYALINNRGIKRNIVSAEEE